MKPRSSQKEFPLRWMQNSSRTKMVFFFKNPQAKTSNPPQKIFHKLLWREFFFTVGSQLPESPEMVNNPLSLQIPWEETPEYLERWKQVSDVR